METYIQMTACGSLARDVPRRNLRRWSLVSCEKVYSLASALCRVMVSAREGGTSTGRGCRGGVLCVCGKIWTYHGGG